jgi:hypothetical protein
MDDRRGKSAEAQRENSPCLGQHLEFDCTVFCEDLRGLAKQSGLNKSRRNRSGESASQFYIYCVFRRLCTALAFPSSLLVHLS